MKCRNYIQLLVLIVSPIFIQGCEEFAFNTDPGTKQISVSVEMTNSHNKAAWIYLSSDSHTESENPQTLLQPGAKRTITIKVFANFAKNSVDFSARDSDAWSVTGLANFYLDTRKYKTEDDLKTVVIKANYTGAAVISVTTNK